MSSTPLSFHEVVRDRGLLRGLLFVAQTVVVGASTVYASTLELPCPLLALLALANLGLSVVLSELPPPGTEAVPRGEAARLRVQAEAGEALRARLEAELPAWAEALRARERRDRPPPP